MQAGCKCLVASNIPRVKCLELGFVGYLPKLSACLLESLCVCGLQLFAASSVCLLVQDVRDNKAEAASAAPQALRLCQMVGLRASFCWNLSPCCYSENQIIVSTAEAADILAGPKLLLACFDCVTCWLHQSLQGLVVDWMDCLSAYIAIAIKVASDRHELVVMHAFRNHDFTLQIGHVSSFNSCFACPNHANMSTMAVRQQSGQPGTS